MNFKISVICVLTFLSGLASSAIYANQELNISSYISAAENSDPSQIQSFEVLTVPTDRQLFSECHADSVETLRKIEAALKDDEYLRANQMSLGLFSRLTHRVAIAGENNLEEAAEECELQQKIIRDLAPRLRNLLR